MNCYEVHKALECVCKRNRLTDAAEQVRDSIMTSRHCTENYLCMWLLVMSVQLVTD